MSASEVPSHEVLSVIAQFTLALVHVFCVIKDLTIKGKWSIFAKVMSDQCNMDVNLQAMRKLNFK